jgi:signal transduction histidine kinase
LREPERASLNRDEEPLRGGSAAFVWLVAVVAIGSIASTGLILPLPPGVPYVATLLYLAVAASMGFVGAVVATRRSHNKVGWTMWLAAILVAVEWFGSVYADFSVRLHGGSLPATILFAWATAWLFYPTVGLILIVIPLLFPDGRLPSPRWWPVAAVAATSITLLALLDAFSAGTLANLTVDNPVGVGTVASMRPLLSSAAVAAFLIVLPIVALGSPIVRFRRGGRVERAQVKWFAYTAGVTGIAAVATVFQYSLGPGTDTPIALLFFIGMAALPISIGVAILRYRLFDIDVLISRSATYALLTLGVIGLYVLVVGALGSVFSSSGNLFTAVIATAVVAVLFEPARVRVQRGINRLMFGDRDDPYDALSRLGQRLEDALAPPEVLPTIVSVVAEALRLPYVAIRLGAGADGSIAAATGEPTPDPVSVPLIYHGEPIGELLLGLRGGDASFNQADRRLLEDFARQVALAAHAVRMTVELQAARELLVTTREEERRRLRRDLHDELGGQLAGINVQMGRLRGLIESDTTAAAELVLELRGEIRTAIGGVRRILQNLRPTVLDQLGLPAALREISGHAARQGLRVTVELPNDLGPLPAAVDVATYRIVQEAFANVERHAHASSCDLHVWVDDGLHVVVRDDGIGLIDRNRSQLGVGLDAMRDRAAELGGTCAIYSDAGGTTVSVLLPVPRS